MSMIRKQFYFEKDEETWLKKEAAGRRTSEASLLRQIVNKYRLEVNKKKGKRNALDAIVGMAKGDVTDSGINHDYYLYGAPKKQP